MTLKTLVVATAFFIARPSAVLSEVLSPRGDRVDGKGVNST